MADYGTAVLLPAPDLLAVDAFAFTSIAWGTAALLDTPSPIAAGNYQLAGTIQPTVLPSAPTMGQIWPRGGSVSPDEVTITGSSPSDPNVDLWVDTSGDAPPPTASVVASTAAVTGATAVTSVTTTIPAGCQAGDMLYLAIDAGDGSATSPLTISATGWTVVTAPANQGTTQRAFYSAPWSAGLAGVQWSTTGPIRWGFVCVAVRNGRTAVVSSTDLGASGTVLTCPDVAATGTGLALRFAVRKDNLSTSITGPAGATTLQSVLGTTGPTPHVAAYSQVQAAAGATGTATVTFSAASANGTVWTVAV